MQHQEAWAFNGGTQPPFRKSVMVEDHFQRGRFSTLSVSNLQIQEKVRTSGRTAWIVETNQHASRAPAIPDRMRKKDADFKHATRASHQACDQSVQTRCMAIDDQPLQIPMPGGKTLQGVM